MVYARRVQLCLHDAASRPACPLNDECGPPGSPPHPPVQLLACSGSSFFPFSIYFRPLFKVQVKVTRFRPIRSNNKMADCAMSLF